MFGRDLFENPPLANGQARAEGDLFPALIEQVRKSLEGGDGLVNCIVAGCHYT
jgi:hypothetical protein